MEKYDPKKIDPVAEQSSQQGKKKMAYDPSKIESKWQKIWEENPLLYAADEKSGKEKFYCLDMFPYPSGDGLHVGHVESYTATDIISRYSRMNGKNVLHPQGWDAFGLPAENYAIKTQTHPSITTKKAIENFKKQIRMLGFSYDWSREVNSSDPEYYKWTQWFFLLLYKNGLAYKKKSKVNWCPKCQTVLANEQAEGGKCERCETEVIQKDLEQWFFKITDFAEDLIFGLDSLDWPQSTKTAQKNWIGRSEGAQFKLPVILNGAKRSEESRANSFGGKISGSFVAATQDDKYFIEVYTTRIDTVFGMTYAVVAPEHPIIEKLKEKIENYSEVEKYIIKSQSKTELERTQLQKEKTGVELKGIKVINLFTKEEIPLFVGDYVLGFYGTGAVMAVPAHDERDWDFAKKYKLPIKEVIIPVFGEEHENEETRKTVTAIVPNKKRDKFLMIHWNEFDWYSPSAGGIDDDETPEKAVEREVFEETGYKIKAVEKLGGEIKMHFFAKNKNVWRERFDQPILCELIDEKQYEVSEEEKNRHEAVWMALDEIFAKTSHKENTIGFERYRKKNYSFADDGTLINSEKYDGLTSEKAREEMTKWLEKEGIGEKKINYKLRDWLVSRQRYWGVPIPIIYCNKCGEVPVSEEDLPVMLPTDVDFKPTGESPLKYSKDFHNVKCPKCGGEARRESDTMDTFVCSSWYYFRYSDPKNKKEFASKEQIKKWLPVDLYVGGAEHTVLHLLYARFFTKVLNKLGYVDFEEPFKKLRHQGIILAEDGNKMSKSKGNVVNPNDVVEEYGADALRLFEMFMGPLEDAKPWNTKGIVGMTRFLEKVWRLQYKVSSSKYDVLDNKLETLLNKTIKKVSEDIENLRFNTAISALMILVNELEKQEKIPIANYQLLITALSPFAPHMAEELWKKLGHEESIFKEKWPKYDPELIKDEEIELVIQVNGKLRDRIKVPADISEDEAKKLAETEKVKAFIGENKIKKEIFVKGKLVNIVI